MSGTRKFTHLKPLTNTEEKVLALALRGLRPAEIRRRAFPHFHADSVRFIMKRLRDRGYEIPYGKSGPNPVLFSDSVEPDPARASILHLLDLKRAGHTTFLYRLRCEYRMKPGSGDRAIAPPLDFVRSSGCGSPAALCEAS